MVTTTAIRTELTNALDYLLDAEIALHTTSVRHDESLITWQRNPGSGKFLAARTRQSSADYRRWIVSGDYSAVLFDGALLQVTYTVAGGSILTHRLAYIPSPFHFDTDLLVSLPFADVLDLHDACMPHEVVLATTVRFDYDLAAASANHAASHLTLNSADCRIPCLAPIRLGRFLDFVFGNFYPSLWKAHPYIGDLPKSGWGGRTLRDEHREQIHLSWAI